MQGVNFVAVFGLLVQNPLVKQEVFLIVFKQGVARQGSAQFPDRAWAMVRNRFKAGVGTVIELLSAQSTLASSRQQRIKALSNWRTARLKLASSLGKLGFGAI